jgi:hypothetical protein
MVVFLFRPSPQVPRPSIHAAIQCYDACEYNIYMTERQIETKSVDLTWIFTQAIFMAINTMVWALSYSEIRKLHPREEVERHLQVSLRSIEVCSERWPGVASALELYRNLITACMKIYDRDGDIPISASSPSDTASVVSSNMVEGINRSRTTSPATTSTTSVITPSDPPFGYLPNQTQSLFSFTQSNNSSVLASSPAAQSSPMHPSPQQLPPQMFFDASPKSSIDAHIPTFNFPPTSQFSPLPTTYAELPSWTPNFSMPQADPYTTPPVSHALSSPIWNESFAANQGYPMTDYLYPQWGTEQNRGMGLNQTQQMELMQNFEANEISKIEAMIHQSNQLFRPHIQTF